MKPVNFFLSAAVQKHRKTPEFQAGMAALAWDGIVGPDVARHARIDRIVNGIAWVRTSSSAWANELMFQKSDILAKMQKLLGAKRIEDIRISRGHHKVRTAADDAPPALPDVPLDEKELQRIHDCSQTVTDPKLRSVLERAMTSMTKRQKALCATGWLKCLACGTLTDDPERQCFMCRFHAREGRHMKVVTALLERPWASPWDLREEIPDLTSEEHARVRGLVLHTTWGDLIRWNKIRKPGAPVPAEMVEKAHCFCEMRTGKPRTQLESNQYDHYLGKRLRQALGV